MDCKRQTLLVSQIVPPKSFTKNEEVRVFKIQLVSVLQMIPLLGEGNNSGT